VVSFASQQLQTITDKQTVSAAAAAAAAAGRSGNDASLWFSLKRCASTGLIVQLCASLQARLHCKIPRSSAEDEQLTQSVSLFMVGPLLADYLKRLKG